MNELFTVGGLTALGEQVWAWILANVFVLNNAVQLVVTAALLGASLLAAKKIRPWIERLQIRPGWARAVNTVLALLFPLVWLTLQWFATLAARTAQWPSYLLELVATLLTAWAIISLVSRLARDPLWSRVIAWTAWSIAALNILNLLGPTIAVLDAAAVSFGNLRVSLYTVVKSTLALAILLSGAIYLTRLLESRIRTSRNLSPSVQVLFTKSLKIVLSGVILLLDKSIKPGDVIAVGQTYGWVSALGGRYVSIVTRDGIEHLIPNETMITQAVENWTHTDNQTRQKVPVGIHYKSDVRLAMDLCIEAACETDRVLKVPEPRCLLIGFGESAVDLELRFWIEDAHRGVRNVRSDVLLRIWDKFHQRGIEIPYPQRDLHIRSPQAVPAEILSGSAA
jgi:small-conductance mechanosensitive channel